MSGTKEGVMVPFAMQYVPEADRRLLRDVRRLIEELPELDLGVNESNEKVLQSCHIVCVALARVIPAVTVHHGMYLRMWQHAWLETSSRNILDPYPVGQIGGPLLHHADGVHTPARYAYVEASKKLRKRYRRRLFTKEYFLHAVKITEAALRRQL